MMTIFGVKVDVPTLRLSDNELNNLIYVFIKYGFCNVDEQFNNPTNELIKTIITDVYNNRSIENIINRTITIILYDYQIYMDEKQQDGLEKHLKLLHRLFMSKSCKLRSDLGEDAKDFVLKN